MDNTPPPPRTSRGFNRFVAFTLRTPWLRWMMGRSVMLITVTGVKTGQRYTTPVEYVLRGRDLFVISSPSRTWWRNLRGGADVGLLLKGSTLQGRAEVLAPTDPVVEQALTGTRMAKVLEKQPDRIVVHVSLRD